MSTPPMTSFSPVPRHLRFAEIGPYTLALGYTCWVVYAGAWLETEVVGHTRWCWVVHAGVGPYTTVFGSNQGVGPRMLVLGLRDLPQCLSYRAFSSWSMRAQGKNENGGEKRSETQQIWALVPPSPTTAWCWRLRQVSDAVLRDWNVQAILGFLIP